jgi:hypothetical protein
MIIRYLFNFVLVPLMVFFILGANLLFANQISIESNHIQLVQFAQSSTDENMLEGFGDEEDDTDEDSDLEGFDDDTESSDLEGFEEDDPEADNDDFGAQEDIDISKILSESENSSPFTFGGFLKEDFAYGFAYEDPDWAKVKSVLNLTFDYKISEVWKSKLNVNGFYDYVYQYRGREEYTDETLEAYESEFEVRDFFIDGSFSNQTYFKFGRQVIAWGHANTSQVNDMLNPRYQRELGIVDLEDARLPVFASKYTKVFNSIVFNVVAVHEIRGDKIAVEGSEFDPFVSLRAMGIQIRDEEVPDSEFKNTEYALRLSMLFNGGDLALIHSNTYEDTPYLDFYELAKPNIFYGQLTVTPRYKRIRTLGLAGSLVSGSWVLKTELAKKYDVAFNRKDIGKQLANISPGLYNEDTKAIKTWSEKNQYQTMLGIEYSGISDLTITFEGIVSRIESYEDNLASNETSGLTYMSFNYSALNDTFNARFIAMHLTDNNGDVYRANLDYDFIDALTGSLGAIYYEADNAEALLYPYRRNDKYFCSIKYSF